MSAGTRGELGAREARTGALDAARIVAIGAVVLSHAMVAYLQDPMPGLLWPVQEPWDTGRVLDGVYVALRCVGVPLVTFVGGMLAARALERRGAGGFVRERVLRLGVPLVLGVALVLPVAYVIWVWGWVERGWASWEHLLHVRFGPAVQPHLHGLGHLWYLQYALLLALLTAGWARLRGGVHLGWLGGVLAVPVVRVVVLAALGAGVLWVWPGVVVDFVNGFLPQVGKVACVAVWFVGGLAAWGVRERVLSPVRTWALVAEVVVLVVGVVLVVEHSPGLRRALGGEEGGVGLQRGLLAVGGGMVAAGCVWVGLEVARRVVGVLGERGRAWASWGAGLTYWVFLTHLVWQGAAVVLLYRVESVGPAVKVGVVFAAGVAGCVLTAGLAERTLVGRWMLGRGGMGRGEVGRERAAARKGGGDGPV